MRVSLVTVATFLLGRTDEEFFSIESFSTRLMHNQRNHLKRTEIKVSFMPLYIPNKKRIHFQYNPLVYACNKSKAIGLGQFFAHQLEINGTAFFKYLTSGQKKYFSSLFVLYLILVCRSLQFPSSFGCSYWQAPYRYVCM